MGSEHNGRPVLPKVDIGPYTKIPNKLFGSGTAAILGTSATLLLVALCEHANRKGCNPFSSSDKALAADTGLSTRKICDARKRLQELRLLDATRREGASYTYSLPKYDMAWVPIRDRPRAKQKARGPHAARNGTTANFARV